tara:strand:+ start:85 stop:447 length:363 start_codon:yes stop_codon:yes gene_type:complete
MNHKQTKVMLLGMDEITFMACLYVIDLRLRILVSEHRMDMTCRIWASTLANRLLVATVAGFDEFEIVSAEMGFFDYPLFGTFGGIFSKVPVYYEYDCLRKHKMAIFSILGGRVKILYIFS